MNRIVLLTWACATVGIGTLLTGLHTLTLPPQTPHRGQVTQGWSVVHSIAQKCPCSRTVLEHLVQRGVQPGFDETVVIVDGTDESIARLRSAGFWVEVATSETLESHYGLTGAPIMVVHRPDGSIAYTGAYAARRNLPPQDLDILTRTRSGEAVAPFPLFGCAVSQALQRQMDPLNLKYGAWK